MSMVCFLVKVNDENDDQKKDINRITTMDTWSIQDDYELVISVREFCRKAQKSPCEVSPYELRIEPMLSVPRSLNSVQLRFLLLRDLNIEIRRLLTLVNLSSDAPLATQISSLRNVIFFDVKMEGFKNALKKNTRSKGSKAHLTINRLASERRLHRKVRRQSKTKLNLSVFEQLNEQLGDVPSEALRCEGQSFRVTLAGEHADDSGGPFRTIFQTVSNELKSGTFDMFIPVPGKNEIYVPNPRCNDVSRFTFWKTDGHMFVLQCSSRYQHGRDMLEVSCGGEELELERHCECGRGFQDHVRGRETSFEQEGGG